MSVRGHQAMSAATTDRSLTARSRDLPIAQSISCGRPVAGERQLASMIDLEGRFRAASSLDQLSGCDPEQAYESVH